VKTKNKYSPEHWNPESKSVRLRVRLTVTETSKLSVRSYIHQKRAFGFGLVVGHRLAADFGMTANSKTDGCLVEMLLIYRGRRHTDVTNAYIFYLSIHEFHNDHTIALISYQILFTRKTFYILSNT
jgi:hypothetical protein